MQDFKEKDIDEKIDRALNLISHPAKIAAVILLDKMGGGPVLFDDFSRKLEGIVQNHYSAESDSASKFFHELSNVGICRLRITDHFRKIRRIELVKMDELLLSIPYFAIDKSRDIRIPFQEIIGLRGNMVNSSGYANRIKFLLSFYLGETHPTSCIGLIPKSRTRRDIMELTGMSYNSVSNQERRLKELGFVNVESNDNEVEYMILNDFSDFITSKPEFRKKMDLLIKSKRFTKGNNVYSHDFKEFFGEGYLMSIMRLKDKGYVSSQRVDRHKITLSDQAQDITCHLLIPIYKAIVNETGFYPITSSREKINGDAETILKRYFKAKSMLN